MTAKNLDFSFSCAHGMRGGSEREQKMWKKSLQELKQYRTFIDKSKIVKFILKNSQEILENSSDFSASDHHRVYPFIYLYIVIEPRRASQGLLHHSVCFSFLSLVFFSVPITILLLKRRKNSSLIELFTRCFYTLFSMLTNWRNDWSMSDWYEKILREYLDQ